MNEVTTAVQPEIAEEAEQVIEAVASGNVSADVFADFGRALLGYLPTVIAAVIIYFIGRFVTGMIIKIVDKSMQRTRIEETAQGFLMSLIKIVLTAFVIVIALSTLGIPMTSIITAIGAAGVAIGLALQNSLSNVAGGFIILFSKPFSKGDYIVSNGIEGVVDEISILSTKLITGDNKVIYIPNGMVSSSTVTNYSHEGKRRVDIVFNVSYEQDHKKAIKIIKDTALAHELVIHDSEPFARITSLSESSVDISLRVWTKTENYWAVYFDLLENVKTALDENNIEIPYRKLDVNIIK